MNLYRVTVDGQPFEVLASSAHTAAQRCVPRSTSPFAFFRVEIKCEGRAPLCKHRRPVVSLEKPERDCWHCRREAAQTAREATS